MEPGPVVEVQAHLVGLRSGVLYSVSGFRAHYTMRSSQNQEVLATLVTGCPQHQAEERDLLRPTVRPGEGCGHRRPRGARHQLKASKECHRSGGRECPMASRGAASIHAASIRTVSPRPTARPRGHGNVWDGSLLGAGRADARPSRESLAGPVRAAVRPTEHPLTTVGARRPGAPRPQQGHRQGAE